MLRFSQNNIDSENNTKYNEKKGGVTVKAIHRWSWILMGVFLLLSIGVSPLFGWLAVACMLPPIGLALFKGRYWCGNLCPRGSFFQYLWNPLRRKLFPGIGKIPTWLRAPATRWTVFVTLMGTLSFRMYRAWGDWAAMGNILLSVIVITTVVGMVLGLLFHPRAWCAVCPMGSLASLIGKGKQNLLIKDSCVNCKRCTKSCPSQLAIGDFRNMGEINHGDCLKCGECVAVCKKGAISKNTHVGKNTSERKNIA